MSHALRRWLSARFGLWRGNHMVFEEAIHEFAAMIDQAQDAATVEAEFVRLVRRIAPSSRIELAALAETSDHDASGAFGECAGAGS